jgi:cation:H+ antiporter
VGLIRVPRVDRQIVVRELPVLLVATALVPVMLLDGSVTTVEAAWLLGLALAYTTWMILTSRRGSAAEAGEVAEESARATGLRSPRGRRALVAMTVIGLAMLIGGGYMLVGGAVGIARFAG